MIGKTVNIAAEEAEIDKDLLLYPLLPLSRFYVLNTIVNHKKMYLLVDTGATSSLIRSDIIGKTKVRPVKLTFQTASKE